MLTLVALRRYNIATGGPAPSSLTDAMYDITTVRGV